VDEKIAVDGAGDTFVAYQSETRKSVSWTYRLSVLATSADTRASAAQRPT
jgi:hypothetical protein